MNSLFNPFSTRLLFNLLFFSLFNALFFASTLLAGTPLQSFYPDVKTITSEELTERFHDVMLIDVRPGFEFDVLRVSTSINLPWRYRKNFIKRFERFARFQPDIEIVLIDNCPESERVFMAAREITALGLKNVLVYDGGVFTWLYDNYARTHLMGTSPAMLGKVLPMPKYINHLLPYDEFITQAKRKNSITIDIRDIYQAGSSLHDAVERDIPLASFLQAIENRTWTEKTLLFVDSDNQRYRTLQVFLQASGYYDYYFLKGGINNLRVSETDRFISIDERGVTIDQELLLEHTVSLNTFPSSSNLLLYVISSIHNHNVALIQLTDLIEQLGLTRGKISEILQVLTSNNIIKFHETDDSFIFLVDPNLAWKGKMQGQIWFREVKNFHFFSKG